MENSNGFGERLKTLRLKNDLTQEEFGKRIGSARNTVANYESENRAPGNAVVALICKEFNVNELWLRTGQGDPTQKLECEQRFAFNIGKLQNTDNETVIRWVNAIAETNPELLKDIESFFMTLLDIKKEPD